MSRSNTVRVLAAVLALSASMLGAQEVPPIYLNFALPGYLSLYPEADYGHPAVILQLDRPVLLNGAYFSGSGGSTLDTHTIDYGGLGAASGTSASSSSTSTNRVGVDGFFPVGDALATGFGAMVDLGFDRSATELTNWTVDPESIATETVDNTQALYGAGYFAWQLGSLDLGARLGMYGSHDPWSAEWTTDPTVAAGVPIVTNFTDNERTFVWNPRLELGGIYRLETLTAGLTASLAWLGTRTTSYRSVDTDTDGQDETVVTEEAFQVSTAAWGAGNTGYTWKDQADEFYVALSPSVVWQATEKLSVVATGRVRVLDRQSVVQYDRILSTDLDLDQLDIRRPAASLTAGVAITPAPALKLRTGVGYHYYGTTQFRIELDAAGVSTFDPANTAHYPEVNWGAEPNNQRVVNSVNQDTDTFSSATHVVLALATLEYRPAPTVLLVGGATAGYTATTDVYRVFNTADASVWEEIVESGSLGVDYSLLLGVGVYVSKTTFVGVRSRTGSFGTLLNWDALPTSVGVTSIGGQGGYNDLSGPDDSSAWTIDLYCVVGL